MMSQDKKRRVLFWLGIGLGTAAAVRLARQHRLNTRRNDLEGRVVVITGASRGIGRALAHTFAAHGAHLVLAARSKDWLRVTAAECEHRNEQIETLVVQTDVSNEGHLQVLVEAAINRFGRIDILVNNAGIVQGGPFVDTPPESLRQQVEINLLAAMRLAQLALPEMVSRGRGLIVNVSSITGRHAMPYLTVYSASKHALAGFGEGLRRELAGTGVDVLTASLGFVYSGMVDEAGAAMLRRFGVRVMQPEEAARRLLDAILLGQVEASIGGIEFAAPWLARAAPRLADWLWQRLMPPEYPDYAAGQHTG